MYGADIGLLHTIQSLDREKYYPIVILPADMPTGMLSPELDRLGVEYHFARLGILRRKYLKPAMLPFLILEMIRGIIYVRSTARSRGVALVYTNTFVTVSGAIGGRLAGIPVLWHVREILSLGRLARWFFYKALELCASRIVCISKAVRNSILQDSPQLAAKSVVVYNAVTVDERHGAGIGLREELGLLEGELLVGMVGRISHWKGQEVLAEAAALVLQQVPNVQFVAVGSYFADEVYYLENLKKLTSHLGVSERFHIVDYKPNVADVYDALDVFVLPSVKPEPFGRVTVEAMTEGRPVIATNHGGSGELIEHGVTGMLVPPSDPQALADAIQYLLRNPDIRKSMGEAAAIHAKANFTLAAYGLQMGRIIDELVA